VRLLDEYIKELGEDTHLDEFTVRDAQLKLPGIKHKWVGRLMRTKAANGKLSKERAIQLSKIIDILMKESLVKPSLPMARSRAEGHETIREIDSQISDNKIIIEFLERVEKIFNSMTFDIRNLTEIMKLETQ
tara:strand:+ start:898 stop:1293 length:396 start_codon:yes stop_codon:yes gene_type:complete